MKKAWLLPPISVAATLLLALVITRWYAPQLLGLPPDLQMVQVGTRIAPFFDGVFRPEDSAATTFILPDPYIKRAKPLYPEQVGMGPNDLLGFRNRAVPDVADVLVIGDSQTYGNNSKLEQNWPSVLQANLPGVPVIYSMAVGGWCAVEYLEIMPKAVLLRPRVVILAFYTGNDPLDSFRLAYSNDRWLRLRPDPTLSASQVPYVPFPAPQSDWWTVNFPDRVSMTFTPKVRFSSNNDHPAVRAGYQIMLDAARQMADIAAQAHIAMVFTIIPTKELVYAKKITRNAVAVIDDYRSLVTAEAQHIDAFAGELRTLPGATYVDLLTPLQDAALESVPLYPDGPNGHPVAAGYEVIGRTLAAAVRSLLPPPPEGPVQIKVDEHTTRLFLVHGNRVWEAAKPELLTGNGWSVDNLPTVSERDLASLPHAGVMDRIDRTQFGPGS